MSYLLGLKALKRYIDEQDALAFVKAKLTSPMFTGDIEQKAFEFIQNHLDQHHVLPHPNTLVAAFPEIKELDAPEPTSYYEAKLDHRFAYNTINAANQASQAILKEDENRVDESLGEMRSAIEKIIEQRYRHQLYHVPREVPKLVMRLYHETQSGALHNAGWGWPFLDDKGGLGAGEVGSVVGRPSRGKTFFLLYCALYNWKERKLDTLFVSMEMDVGSISQRIVAMYGHTNLAQLRTGSYATGNYNVFRQRIRDLGKEPGALYLMDGSMVASMEDIFALAAQLRCKVVCIDGAYLVRHRNTRLDRYTRVAENMELCKRLTTELQVPTFASWQFSREAVRKQDKKKGDNKVGLEDIAYSDTIGQISSVVLGLFQAEGVETMLQRLIDVLKGRGGETGQFKVHWDHNKMDFSQVSKEDKEEIDEKYI